MTSMTAAIRSPEEEEAFRQGFWWGFERARMTENDHNISGQYSQVMQLRRENAAHCGAPSASVTPDYAEQVAILRAALEPFAAAWLHRTPSLPESAPGHALQMKNALRYLYSTGSEGCEGSISGEHLRAAFQALDSVSKDQQGNGHDN